MPISCLNTSCVPCSGCRAGARSIRRRGRGHLPPPSGGAHAAMRRADARNFASLRQSQQSQYKSRHDAPQLPHLTRLTMLRHNIRTRTHGQMTARACSVAKGRRSQQPWHLCVASDTASALRTAESGAGSGRQDPRRRVGGAQTLRGGGCAALEPGTRPRDHGLCKATITVVAAICCGACCSLYRCHCYPVLSIKSVFEVCCDTSSCFVSCPS